MAVRKSYTLRTPLDESVLNRPIDLSISGGVQFKRQITVKTLCIGLLAFLAVYGLISHTFLLHGGPLFDSIFLVGYIWFVSMLVIPTKTHLEGYNELLPAWRYSLDDFERNVSTRSIARIKPVRDLIGINGISADNSKQTNNSLIEFSNGDVGEILELVGNASILTFDSDRRDILDSANVFYRRLHANLSLTFDSVSSAQRVVDQLVCKNRQFNNMTVHEPHLRNMVIYQREIIKDFVGKQFKAWHQFVTVRGNSRDTINAFNKWLYSCTQQRGLFVSSYRKLDTKEMKRYLKTLYGDDITRR